MVEQLEGLGALSGWWLRYCWGVRFDGVLCFGGEGRRIG